MKDIKFDVFVIGSGVAGQTVAKICTSNGLKVAIADDREFGGTCANRGCDPKKVLLGPVEVNDKARNLLGKGISTLPDINWKRLQKFKRTFTDPVPSSTEKNLTDLGITLFHQSPRFLDTNTLSVEGKTVIADKIVIATGQKPRKLEFDGHQYLKTSDDFLKLKKLPKKIIFIGGGYIGMEFAHMASRAGSKVVVLEQEVEILDSFDRNLVAYLKQASEDIGIKFYNRAEVSKIQKLRKNFRIRFKINGVEGTLKSGIIFNTAGRVPVIAELGAHLLAPEAAETINLFAMAINQGTTVDELKKMIFTYPSWANDIKSML